jgi:hypothetical protein
MNTPVTPESLLHQISQIQHMERGKLCVMRQGPQGSYYSHQSWEAGKNSSRYVPREQVPALQEAIAGYQQFEQLTDQYAQLMIETSRAERAAGAKKKTPPPSSSWPRSRKSKT